MSAAPTPDPPYWAVVFTNRRARFGDPATDDAYAAAAARMDELAAAVPGHLGVESVRDDAGMGITVSYWSSPDAIEQWRRHPEHLEAQARGRTDWYEWYELRVARVDRAGRFP